MMLLSESNSGEEPRRAVTPHLRRILLTYWATALRDYAAAGMPFGDEENGMMMWFQFGQFTTSN